MSNQNQNDPGQQQQSPSQKTGQQQGGQKPGQQQQGDPNYKPKDQGHDNTDYGGGT